MAWARYEGVWFPILDSGWEGLRLRDLTSPSGAVYVLHCEVDTIIII